MNTTLSTIVASEWAGQLVAFGDALNGRTAVIGDRAAEFAAALQRAGAPPPALVTDSIGPALDDLLDSSLDLVVLRRVWKAPAGVEATVRAARRCLAPGGRIVAADFDVERVLGSPLWRYPSQFLYTSHPDVAARLERSSASVLDLAVALVRAEFGDVVSADVDETIGEFDDAAEYRDAVAAIGWRGFEDLSAAEVDAVLSGLSEVLPVLLRSGPVPLREPWVTVTGIKRS